MLSRIAVRSVAHSARGMLPSALAGTRNMTVGDTLKKKGSVEEDRYIREQEKKYIEKKRAEMHATMSEKSAAEELAHFNAKVAPLMAEADLILKNTGDTVSSKGLEAIAKWKLAAGH